MESGKRKGIEREEEEAEGKRGLGKKEKDSVIGQHVNVLRR